MEYFKTMLDQYTCWSDCSKLVSEMKSKRLVYAAMKRQNSVNESEIEEVPNMPPGSQRESWLETVQVYGNSFNIFLPSGVVSPFGIHNARVLRYEYAIDDTVSSRIASESCNASTGSSSTEQMLPIEDSIDGPASRTRSSTRQVSFVGVDEDANDFYESLMAKRN